MTDRASFRSHHRLCAVPVQLNAGFDYSRPVGRYLARFFVNNAYRSGTHLAASESDFAYPRAYSLTDAGISFGTRDGKYDLSLVAKNLFDKQYATGAGTFSGSGAVTLQPGYDRTFAAVFRTKLSILGDANDDPHDST